MTFSKLSGTRSLLVIKVNYLFIQRLGERYVDVQVYTDVHFKINFPYVICLERKYN